MALKALLDSGHIKYIISQNIDGLHLRSGVARKHLAELHGNMFIENCDKCRRFAFKCFFILKYHVVISSDLFDTHIDNTCDQRQHRLWVKKEQGVSVGVAKVLVPAVEDIWWTIFWIGNTVCPTKISIWPSLIHGKPNVLIYNRQPTIINMKFCLPIIIALPI